MHSCKFGAEHLIDPCKEQVFPWNMYGLMAALDCSGMSMLASTVTGSHLLGWAWPCSELAASLTVLLLQVVDMIALPTHALCCTL